ncbi:MAG: hypothetical protein LJE57_09365 [Gallionella sp.]|nr:hypothetical protein [Gallionella sp.]
MSNPEPMPESEPDIVEQKVKRAAAVSALRKIGRIVDREQQADAGKVGLLRWIARYGWIALPAVVLLGAYLIVKI